MLDILAQVFDFGVPRGLVVVVHFHAHAEAAHAAATPAAPHAAVVATVVSAIVAGFHGVGVAGAASLTQVRPALKVPVGGVLEYGLERVDEFVDVLGMPYTAAELRPAFLVLLLEGVVAPQVLYPLCHEPFSGTALCALRYAPAFRLLATHALVGSECEVEVPRGAKLELASLAVLVLEHVETADVGVGVVGDIFVDDVVYRGFDIQDVGASVAHYIALVALLLDGVEEVLDILLLLLVGVFLFRGTHDDGGAVLALESFLVETACGVVFHLVDTEYVAAGHLVTVNVFVLELSDMYAGLGSFDFLEQQVHALVLPVQVELEKFESGTVAARALVEPVGECVADERLVDIRPVEHPVSILGHAENLEACVVAGRIGDVRAGARLELYAVALLWKIGGCLPADLDANVVLFALGTVGSVVRALVQDAHCRGNLVGAFLERLPVLGVHDDKW